MSRQAWPFRKKWDPGMIKRYRKFATSQAKMFASASQKFTSEDLALRLVIEFAASNYLPISITTAKKSFRPSQFRSKGAYLERVLTQTSAIDLLDNANTSVVGTRVSGNLGNLKKAQAGDLIFVRLGGKTLTVQVVTLTSHTAPFTPVGHDVHVVQGGRNGYLNKGYCFRTTGKTPSQNPNAPCYVGVPMNTDIYDSYGHSNSSAPWATFSKFKGIVRQWNFSTWK